MFTITLSRGKGKGKMKRVHITGMSTFRQMASVLRFSKPHQHTTNKYLTQNQSWAQSSGWVCKASVSLASRGPFTGSC